MKQLTRRQLRRIILEAVRGPRSGAFILDPDLPGEQVDEPLSADGLAARLRNVPDPKKKWPIPSSLGLDEFLDSPDIASRRQALDMGETIMDYPHGSIETAEREAEEHQAHAQDTRDYSLTQLQIDDRLKEVVGKEIYLAVVGRYGRQVIYRENPSDRYFTLLISHDDLRDMTIKLYTNRPWADEESMVWDNSYDHDEFLKTLYFKVIPKIVNAAKKVMIRERDLDTWSLGTYQGRGNGHALTPWAQRLVDKGKLVVTQVK